MPTDKDVEGKLYWYRAIVTGVYDGDTLTADIDLGFGVWRRGVKLRLAGIDAPELRRPTLVAGRLSRAALQMMVGGRACVIRSKSQGSYNRWIADLFARDVAGWVNVGAWMIEHGYAAEWYSAPRPAQNPPNPPNPPERTKPKPAQPDPSRAGDPGDPTDD